MLCETETRMAGTSGIKNGGATLVERTYAALRDLIVDGHLAPGTRVVETDLAPRLDVSRRTLQAALQRLKREGLIQRAEGKRAPWSVSPLTDDDCREISDVMSAILGWAGRCAAELPDEARLPLVGELNAINDELRAIESGGPEESSRAADLDVVFHDLILEAIAGPRLTAIYDSQKPTVERYAKNYATYLAATSATSGDEHRAIIDAIERGDPDAAERESRRNWQNAADRYCEVMGNVGEQGTW
jgi:DNA-binding GntR family transcriptional regulator